MKKKSPNKKVIKRNKGKWQKGQSGNPATMFQKGVVNNPAGRPPKIKYISELLRDKIKEICGSEDNFKNVLEGVYKVGTEEITFGKILVSAMLKHSLKGNSAMLKELLDRTEGKVPLIVGEDPENPFSQNEGLFKKMTDKEVESELSRLKKLRKKLEKR